MAQLVDMNVLRNLRDLSPEDPEFALGIIRIFLDTTPADLEKLRQYFKNNQAVEMGRVAHGLTSSAQNMGIGPMSAILHELDSMGREGKLDGAGERIESVFKMYAEAKQIFDEILRSGKIPTT